MPALSSGDLWYTDACAKLPALNVNRNCREYKKPFIPSNLLCSTKDKIITCLHPAYCSGSGWMFYFVYMYVVEPFIFTVAMYFVVNAFNGISSIILCWHMGNEYHDSVLPAWCFSMCWLLNTKNDSFEHWKPIGVNPAIVSPQNIFCCFTMRAK